MSKREKLNPKTNHLRRDLMELEKLLDEAIGNGEEHNINFCRIQIAAIKKQLAVK